VDTVRAAGDIDRLIPEQVNSHDLKLGLKAILDQTAPYRIYTYRDSKGGSFVGIDLAATPALVEQIPVPM
jgi:hypothetical protein